MLECFDEVSGSVADFWQLTSKALEMLENTDRAPTANVLLGLWRRCPAAEYVARRRIAELIDRRMKATQSGYVERLPKSESTFQSIIELMRALSLEWAPKAQETGLPETSGRRE